MEFLNAGINLSSIIQLYTSIIELLPYFQHCKHTVPVGRAQYDDGPILNTQIFNINMDSAGVRNTGQGKAVFVEECRCPAGYTGLSCEVSFSYNLNLFVIKPLYRCTIYSSSDSWFFKY
jgi:hypothetical protein